MSALAPKSSIEEIVDFFRVFSFLFCSCELSASASDEKREYFKQ